ncbi:MAG: DNA topoisomerase IV subunit A [Mycoplasmataceae bacterium]|nr:DNA topoisomerase IV subunit A [Mycoplasmataceae bacterium]
MANKIINENLDRIIARTFGNYSKYIIQDRALPDVRDGLKPVQRRILYAMADSKIFYNTQYKKSARVVGEVIGKYHPHGDSSVYEAVVRMAQDWKMNMPLIEMHGNKGSVDGDSPAAMRYTEIRLSKISDFLIQGMRNDTVNFVNNFDDNEIEPTIFPSRYPNILVNGSVGIAAGYSTNIPPHNLDEIIQATIIRLKKKNSTVDDILEVVKGPDFPTKGILVDTSELKKIYETGKGKVKLRSDIKIDKENNQLVVKSIPYEVNKQELVKSINELIFMNKLPGVKTAIDHTDRTGMRIIIECDNKTNLENIKHFLFKSTELQKNYNFNMVAISHNKPKQMGILEILDSYIAHQIEIYTREFSHELKKNLDRLEIVDGLVRVVDIIDDIIRIIRSSKNKKDSKLKIIEKYEFTEKQAEAIVTLKLYRLASTDINLLINEKSDLEKRITWLRKVLESNSMLRKIISDNLMEIKKAFVTKRKTLINNNAKSIEISTKDLIKKEDRYIFISSKGYIKSLTKKSYMPYINDELNMSYQMKSDDLLVSHTRESVSSLDNLVLFTNKGRYILIPIHKLKKSKWKDFGQNINEFDTLLKDEFIIKFAIYHEFTDDYELISLTESGYIKRSSLELLETSRKMKFLTFSKIVDDTDSIVGVEIMQKNKESSIVVVTELTKYLHYSKSLIPTVGLKSKGVKAIKLSENDILSGLISYDNEESHKTQIGLISKKGKYKRIHVSDLQLSESRNSKGKNITKPIKTNPSIIFSVFSIQKQSDSINILDEDSKWTIVKANKIDITNTENGMSKILDKSVVDVYKDNVFLLKKKILNKDTGQLDIILENDASKNPVSKNITKNLKEKKKTKKSINKDFTLEIDINDLID